MTNISYASDIAPLFRPKDIACMKPHGVKLDSYEYMSDEHGDGEYEDYANARHVLARVSGEVEPRMPLGAPPWPDSDVDQLRQWVAARCPP